MYLYFLLIEFHLPFYLLQELYFFSVHTIIKIEKI